MEDGNRKLGCRAELSVGFTWKFLSFALDKNLKLVLFAENTAAPLLNLFN